MKTKLLLCSLALAGLQVMSELSAQCPVGINYIDVSCYGGNNGSAIATSLGVSPYTYVWSNGQTTQTATGLVAGTYTITVTDGSGCTDTQVVTITQPSPLTAAVSTTPDYCGQCNGSITATTSGGTGAYNWSIDGGITFQPGNVFYNLCVGNYTITVADANGCTANVASTVVASSNLSITTTQTNIGCNGASQGSATANVIGGGGAYTYLWSPPGQTTQTAIGLPVGTYTVVVADASGCTGTQTVAITAGAGPTAALVATLTCSGTNIQFLDGSVAAAGDPITSWNWIMPGGTPATAQTQNASAMYPAGTYTVSLTIGTQQGCLDTIYQQVQVYNTPVASFSTTVTGCVFPLCSDFTDLSTSIDGNITNWQWSFVGGNPATSTQQNPTNICYNIAGNYNVSLIVTTNYGCSDTLIMPLTAGSIPTVFISGPAAICAGGTANLCASASGAVTYLWLPGGQTTACIAETPLATTTYTVVVTNAAGCTGIGIINVAVTTASTSMILVKDSVNPLVWYAYIHVTGTAPFTYAWDFGDGNTSTQPTPTHTYAVVGNYVICLTITDANGCTATTCDTTSKLMSAGAIQTLIVINTTTGIEENIVSVNSVFPNPANDMIEVSLSQFVEGELRFTDITGREVYVEKINSDNVRVNVSSLLVGYYNLSIVSGTQTIHSKMMIAR